MARISTTKTNMKDFTLHVPQTKITQEEEANRFKNLKTLLAKAKTIYTSGK